MMLFLILTLHAVFIADKDFLGCHLIVPTLPGLSVVW